MRVAVDGRTLQSRPVGGVGRTLRGVLPHLAAACAGEGILLGGLDVLTDARLAAPDLGPAGAAVTVNALGAPGAGRGVAWLQLAAPGWLAAHRDAGDVRLFHCPFYGLPYRQPVPMVVSIWDLTFLDRGAWFRPSSRLAFRAQARHAARTARAVVTGSRTVADRITGDLGVPEARVVVSPPALDPVFLSPRVADDCRARPQHPYALALGGAPRRNLVTAVEAWRTARARGADLDLVVVGALTADERSRIVTGTAPVPRLAGAVPDDELACLLAGAAAFLYPTAYEGFGLPALEAAAAGAPVVCAPVGALPEVLGDAPVWCGPPGRAPSAGELALALLGLLEDPSGAAAHSAAGRLLARDAPDHRAAAQAWAGAYRSALDG